MVSGLGLGGAERQIVLLSRELARLGHQVGIYTLNRRVTRADELAGMLVKLIVDHKQFKLDVGVLARLRRHIRAWQPDVVHGFLYDGNLYARLAGWGSGAVVLNSERNDNYAVSAAQRIGLRLTSALCDGIVANSHAGAHFARNLHHMPEEDVHVVWNGIDLAEIDARLVQGSQPARELLPGACLKRLCLVGALKPQKDHILALRVLKRLVEQDDAWRLLCVGDEPSKPVHGYKPAVLAECAHLGLEPFVRFVGHRRDVPELMASSDLLLVTSVHEGFPNAVLEAMACGTAVVSTDYSDVRRILPAAGQVVGSRDAEALAGAVARCYAQRGELAKLQRRWVEKHATASASALALLAAYGKYLARPAAMAGGAIG